MINRIYPNFGDKNDPCLIVSLKEALETNEIDTSSINIKADGYIDLANARKLIKKYFPNSTYEYFKKDERIGLFHFTQEGKFIILTLGHFSYLDNFYNHSFYDNYFDEIVAYWKLD